MQDTRYFDRIPGPLNLAYSHLVAPKFITLLSTVGFLILMTLSTDLFCCQNRHQQTARKFIDILINKSWGPILTMILFLWDLEQVI